MKASVLLDLLEAEDRLGPPNQPIVVLMLDADLRMLLGAQDRVPDGWGGTYLGLPVLVFPTEVALQLKARDLEDDGVVVIWLQMNHPSQLEN